MSDTAPLSHRYRLEPGAGEETLLLLHGTGGDESDLLQLGRALAPRATLLGVRGQVLEQGMPRFFRRLAPGVYDEPDVIARAHALAAFVRAAAQRHGFDPARIDALGYSNGANIAAALLLLEPGLLRRAALLRADLPLKDAAARGLRGTRVLIAAGAHDPLIPRERSQALCDRLSLGGADVTLRVADAGHELSNEELQAVGSWLAQGGGPED